MNEENNTGKNTDTEIWRRKSDDKSDPDNHYQPSIHVTIDGKIGIDVGGTVYLMEVEQWHKLGATVCHDSA